VWGQSPASPGRDGGEKLKHRHVSSRVTGALHRRDRRKASCRTLLQAAPPSHRSRSLAVGALLSCTAWRARRRAPGVRPALQPLRGLEIPRRPPPPRRAAPASAGARLRATRWPSRSATSSAWPWRCAGCPTLPQRMCTHADIRAGRCTPSWTRCARKASSVKPPWCAHSEACWQAAAACVCIRLRGGLSADERVARARATTGAHARQRCAPVCGSVPPQRASAAFAACAHAPLRAAGCEPA
jgi:hypothetical protein